MESRKDPVRQTQKKGGIKDSSKPVGFDGSEKYITEREIEEVKEFAKQFMD